MNCKQICKCKIQVVNHLNLNFICFWLFKDFNQDQDQEEPQDNQEHQDNREHQDNQDRQDLMDIQDNLEHLDNLGHPALQQAVHHFSTVSVNQLLSVLSSKWFARNSLHLNSGKKLLVNYFLQSVKQLKVYEHL